MAVAATGLLPAQALATPGSGAATSTTAAAGDTRTKAQAANDSARVRRISKYDPRALVRTSALAAWISEHGDTAIVRFLYAGGMVQAIEWAERSGQRNLDFAQRVMKTHLPEYSPNVHAAAKAAVNGDDAARERFARTGYAQAKDLDQKRHRDQVAKEEQIKEADRQFVRQWGLAAPGPQVRAAAEWALRPHAQDGDIVEFLRFDWISAAALDRDVYRTDSVTRDQQAHRQLADLVAAAHAAEAAEAAASEEMKEQAQQARKQAWGAAAETARRTETGWLAEAERSAAQARHWQEVAAHAATALNSPTWQALAAPARANQRDWADEQGWSDEQRRYWTAQVVDAEAGQNR
ncbi:hypothetical protein [Crossiella equi]|uniref:hypothetical protein n=1 Tax=Crossiella equi TaxID=130796 RepID=UPI001AE97C4F|nr:hypothetical protein [Crossiella equi]